MTENNEILHDLNDSFHLVDDEHHEDFGSFSKEELTKFIESFNFRENYSKGSPLLHQLKHAFDHIHDHEREEALHRYLNEGGEEADFEFKKDAVTLRFEKAYHKVKGEIAEFFSQQEKSKQQNLTAKLALLERLRTLISSEESALNLEEFRHIQDAWKHTGPVPAAQAQELYANYKALVDIFYNNRSLIFDLLELDRKKNLEHKLELCEKAEKLSELDSINQALKELKVLHEEFRHIGPVPKDEQENVWNRFKAASDHVYDRRKEYFDNVKKEHETNLVKKQELLQRVEEYTTFESTRIDDWKVKTTELTKLQDDWKNVGPVPADKTKEVNHLFWEACKIYYRHKNNFFKQLDKKREDNLKLKTALCEKADALLASEDLEHAIREVKEIQKQWEKIGQVPFKFKESIYTRFKASCDAVFQKKRDLNAEAEKEFVDNLEKKKALCERAEAFLGSSEPKTVEILNSFQEEWDSIGFVPRDSKKDITERFNKAMNALIENSDDIPQEQKKTFRLTMDVMTLKASADGMQTLKKKEHTIAKKISETKAEIDRYKTNIEFFGKSKSADKMKQEIQANIDKLEVELKALQAELKIMKN
jgi:hypothetical protein